MFLGRNQELNSLEKMYSRNSFQMAVVYGRRRIGKTSLLNEFIKNKNALYLPAEEVNDSLNLQKFSRILGEKMGIPNFPTVDDWNHFFNLIKTQFENQHLVLVIDEYPYAASANKSLNSILQHIIDYELKDTNIFLILCGSSMSFMENQVLGEKSPLFGRRTGQLKINPLDYYDSSLFYSDVSSEDKIRYYACVGGTPYYLSLINPELSFEENIRDLYFEISGYLNNEGILLMKQEFREPANYNAVLQAIASGSNTLSEISGFTKLDSNLISKYLITLQELNYIERIVPFGSNPLKGKTSQYHITENFIAFWYRYIFSTRTEIERGNGDIYFRLAMDDLSNFIGPIFEEVTRQFLRRLNSQGKLPFVAKSFGRWWGKDRAGKVQEVDVILESVDGRELLIGECKWRSSLKIGKTIGQLQERSEHFNHYVTYKYLFTKSPVELRNVDVLSKSLDDYFE
ncbi:MULTISPECIES: ATP-binding protein [unclassified Streptococcus]|uniref:ATP-binding protein n=1 Tax=unclassified Streptococcus TaxID=2608887 RepID=UPI0010725037|nr:MULTISPECIES: ATP-binding protein [unclassified Streptococcus]MBF0806483.1 ATP-binding protein [Streptococcus sp. 19428wA2_WM07]TFU27889.1 ATP-binding protein [Streptococcus sp. WM07]